MIPARGQNVCTGAYRLAVHDECKTVDSHGRAIRGPVHHRLVGVESDAEHDLRDREFARGVPVKRERERESEASLGTEATALEAAVQTVERREPSPAKEPGPDPAGEKAAEPELPTRGKAIEMDMSL